MRNVLASLVLFALVIACSSEQNGTGHGGRQLVVQVKVSRDRTVRVCPVVTGISAFGLQTKTGHELALEGGSSSPADLYSWSGEGGDFETPDAVSTLFQCSEAGLQTLTFHAGKLGCPDSSASVEVQCGEL